MASLKSGVLLAALAVSACGGGGSSNPVPVPEPDDLVRTPIDKLALKTFAADCSDFLAYAADALTEQYLTPYYCFAEGPCPVFADSAAPPPSATPAPESPVAGGDSAGPDRVSGTNTQEAGVDEADIVKAGSDGRLYILTGRTLQILPAFPAENLGAAELTSLELAAGDPSYYASDFFLDEDNDRLVVMGSTVSERGGRAEALIVDIADRTSPQIVRRAGVDGWPLQARRVDTRVHRVSRFDVPAPAWFYDGSDELVGLRQQYYEAQGNGDSAGADTLKAQIRTEIGDRVAASGAADFLPHRVSVVGDAVTDTALPCDAISHPDVTTALGLAVVDSFDTDGGNAAASAVVNNAYLVYASRENLYLVQSSFGWWFDAAQAEESAIYRLALSDTGPAAYQALGKVEGSLFNSYQLSEYDGHLRAASTENRLDGDTFTSYNHVTVLDANATGTMAQTGVLRDLAPGETIQGSRFIGPRGFVVTFRQIDPLFAIDLSDPTRPTVADELKIPGFSSYLMPLGDDYLLTIGRAGTDEALTGQLAIQLFDVADLGNIAQVGSALTPADGGGQGYSYSVAEYDPHAFSYFADRDDAPVPGTLSVPLQSYDETGESFTGFFVVRVDPAVAQAPLSELGRVDHTDLIDESQNYGCPPPDSGILAPCYIYAADPRRSVFMQADAQRYLYTISSVGIIASDAAQPQTVYGSRTLPYDGYCCGY